MRDGLERVSNIMEANTYRWSNLGVYFASLILNEDVASVIVGSSATQSMIPI
jgi:hypothetical protein